MEGMLVAERSALKAAIRCNSRGIDTSTFRHGFDEVLVYQSDCKSLVFGSVKFDS